MSNLLKMAVIDTILTLDAQGMSQRQIADTLGIHRETVARYLRQAAQQPKPAIAPIGADPNGEAAKPAIAPIGADPNGEAAKPAIAPIGADPNGEAAKPAIAPIGADPGPIARGVGRPSDSEPWRQTILAKLELGLSAQRI